MVLSLVTPQPSNFIKDFPGVHGPNMDAIDAYAGPCLTSHPMQSYTPVLSAVTTSPVLGTGSIARGFFYRIFDQIFAWGEFRFGTSGTSFGSGIYLVTLPVAADSIVGATVSMGAAPSLGNAYLWDETASADRQPLIPKLRSSTQLMFGIKMGSGLADREVTHNSPITMANQDGISWQVRYKRQT